MVPAGQAVNPDRPNGFIFDPAGTINEADPPSATMEPGLTGVHLDCCGFDCNCPGGQCVHCRLPSVLENLPGEQGTQETEPVLLVYVPVGHSVFGEAAPAHV